jgi:predicted MFS family arabinose efflux permease
VIGLAVVSRAFSVLAQYRILSTTKTRPREVVHGLRAQVRLIADNQPLVRFYVFGAVFGLMANFFGPFFNVFMYDALNMSVADVTMLLVISNVTGAIALPAWGQFLDRYGNRPIMAFALIMWMLPGYAWALLHPGNTWILKLLYASGGVFQAGFLLGQFNMLLKLVPPEAKTVAISLNVATTSLATAVAPIIGGMLLDHALDAGHGKLPVYHVMVLVHHTIVILAALVLLRVAEPKAAALSQVVGAMRSTRQLFALMGLSFLVNYVFTRDSNDRHFK